LPVPDRDHPGDDGEDHLQRPRLNRHPLASSWEPAYEASGTLVKVFGWYDNEWGYKCRLADLGALVAGSCNRLRRAVWSSSADQGPPPARQMALSGGQAPTSVLVHEAQAHSPRAYAPGSRRSAMNWPAATPSRWSAAVTTLSGPVHI
jgi:hypothetical protein